MAYDRRGYYYRSHRDGDRVRRVYLGNGPIAHLSSLMVEQRRVEAVVRSRAWQAGEAARVPAEVGQHELDGLADRMMRATLLAAGYHRHDRGPWRRRRMNGDGATNGVSPGPEEPSVGGTHPASPAGPGRAAGSSPINPGDRPLAAGELADLLGRAERGDRTVLPALREVLDAVPALWRQAGDVARTAEAAWIGLIAGQDLMVRESLTRKVADLKAELAVPGAPPLERLLVGRVACCWMQAAHADAALAALKGGGASIAQLEMLQRRQGRAQRSYLAAMKALAMVRRLAAVTPPIVAAGVAEVVKAGC